MNGAEPVAGPSRTPSPPIPNGKSTLKLPAVDGSPRPSTERSFDLPSLQPLSHDHPLLSAPTFDADTFLLSRIYIPLEELRAELREYLAVLREELVQLINDDYEEFISLGIGLRGEGDRLRELQEPLKVLEEEAELVRDNLKVHQDAIQEKLEERSLLREEKTLLDMLQRLFDTLGRAESLLDNDEEDRLKSVVRAAGEYTQLIYLLGKASSEGCKVVQLVIPRVEGIKSRLHVELSALLLDAMNDTSSFTKLKTVLKIYDQVEGWNEASDVVRNAFRTFCASTITSTALLVPPTPGVPDTPLTPVTPMISVMQYELHEQAEKLSDDSALASIYNAVLLQVESYGSLMSISEDLSQNFDVFAGVLWPEIAQAIMDNLGSVIFAAGRPDELHQNYTITHDFITRLENLAPSAQSISSARSSPVSETFERRWQLPVYFQLRWKAIVTALETALAAPSTSSGTWSLSQSAAVSKALSTCFADDVFLHELAYRFWRLALQIASRYNTWLLTRLGECEVDEAGDEQALKLSASVVMDLDGLQEEIKTIPRLKDKQVDFRYAIPNTPFTDKIIDILTKRCTDSLKLVRSVASQFRAAPTKSTDVTPSYFIPSILKPLHAFYSSKPALASAYGEQWSVIIIDSVLSSYAGILAGVRKTEDLLRRHRKSKKGGFSLFGGNSAASEESGAGEEEDRFKRQMQVDIEALAADAKKLGVDVEQKGLEGWTKLVEVVNRPPE